MTTNVLSRAALLLIGAGLAATSAVGADRRTSAQGICPPAAPTESVRLTLSARGDNSLIADATVELDRPAPVYLEYGTPEAGWLRTPTTAAATAHQVTLLRMRAQSPYQVRAFALDEGGCPSGVAAADFATGPLPPILSLYTTQTSGEASFALTLVDWPSLAAILPPQAPGDRGRYLIATDRSGKTVWYYRVPDEYPIPPRDVMAYPLKQKANGNLYYPAVYYSVEEITPGGQIVHHLRTETGPGRLPHHDVEALPDGRYLYLGAEDREIDDSANGGPPNLMLRGDTLHVIDPATGSEQLVWNAFDSLDPKQRLRQWDQVRIDGVIDWTHANGLSVGPRGNVLISIRHLNQIISIAPDLRRVEWKLGGPGSSFTFADPTDRFYAQHSAAALENGNVLLFDNGNFRPDGEYSRAIELALDMGSMTARKVWEYRAQPDIYSGQLSSVHALPNGNRLVNFGWRDAPEDPGVLVEARSDGSEAYRQDMVYNRMRAIRYRMTPITSLAGEMPVEPTAISLP